MIQIDYNISAHFGCYNAIHYPFISESGLTESVRFKLVNELSIEPTSLTMFNYEEGIFYYFSPFTLSYL